jgi:hypothetical protein
MGDELTVNQPPTISVEVIGTTGVEKVEIIRGVETVHVQQPAPSNSLSNTIKIVWSGARVTTRRRNTDWSGELTLDKGKIKSAEEFAFDLPWDGIIERTDQRVRWSSTTSGDFDGLILNVEAPDDARLSFNTKPVQFSFQIGQLRQPLTVEAGDFEQKVQVSCLSGEEMPVHVQFDYTDREARPGVHAYWVKCLLTDGEKAWSSPIFVNYDKS